MPISPRTPESASADEILRRLEWTVLRRLDGLLQGDYRTLFRGSGLDLADLREYQHHDDVRYIDWNVTARLQTPYVREYNEARELAAWLLLDLSGSIDFGSQQITKHSLARDFCAVLARLLTRRGNRVGAILYGAGIEAIVPARGGRTQVLQILHRIATRPPAPRSPGTDLGALFAAAQRTMARRSLGFVVSDFLALPGWEPALGRLAQRHEIVAVRLSDPLERALPDLGLLLMQDAETGEQLFVDTHDRALRRRFEQAAGRRERVLREGLARAGVDALELSTDEDLVDAILRFAELRAQRSRLAAGGGLPARTGAPR